ncbi:MAG: hypothetical protein F4201_09865 [Nitrospira sp. SB0677_bin_15]|nr:hypothetical protein [Nitrospira sp. SB0677_bin_15]
MIRLVPLWVSVFLGFMVFSSGVLEAKELSGNNLLNIVGPEECGECHKAEVHVWRETRHSTTFNVLTRKKRAREIAGNMGIRRVKKAEACVTCHFTSGYRKNKVKAIAGISCESCHGPAKDWLKVHGDYGGKNVTREQETPKHKARRLAAIRDAGMIRPRNLYRLAANCYQCHVVSDEKLVNVGGHGPGNGDFELVSWSLGEVRHKFLRSEGKKNEEVSPERKRLLYVVGKALDLEYGLRALAKVTKKGKYATETMKRVQRAAGNVQTIAALIDISEVRVILKIIKGIGRKIRKEVVLAAAGRIAAVNQKLAGTRDGSQLSALDQIIPKAGQYKGKPGGPPERVTRHDLLPRVGRLNWR